MATRDSLFIMTVETAPLIYFAIISSLNNPMTLIPQQEGLYSSKIHQSSLNNYHLLATHESEGFENRLYLLYPFVIRSICALYVYCCCVDVSITEYNHMWSILKSKTLHVIC